MTYSGSSDSDSRDYQVSCDLLSRELPPDVQLTWTVERGIEQLVRVYHDQQFGIEALLGDRFRRLDRIVTLGQSALVDRALRWVA